MGERYADRLCNAIDRAGTPACVGIDPVVSRLPASVRASSGSDADAARSFCLEVLDALDADLVPAVKPQSACFERFGAVGVAILEDVVAKARDRGLLVVLDVKRGDIGSTAEHYAAAALGLGADAVTVNGYMGRSAVEPFVESGLGVYVLVRTSNPDSDELQTEPLVSGGTVAQRMASVVHDLGRSSRGQRGLSDVGAVVGATKRADEVEELRGLMPDAPVLVPGVGAQGGTIEQVRPLVRAGSRSIGEAGVLINASRSVLFSGEGGSDWVSSVRAAAEAFARECASITTAE